MDLNEIQTVDFHMHSTVSDGTDTPREILRKVREAGIDMFSLTDHDACLGCVEISKIVSENDPKFVTGIELSCKDEKGKYHILGYGYDPEDEAIQNVIKLGHEYRMEKCVARIEFLKQEFGFEFPKEDIETIMANNNPGKPHIGNMMVKCGFAESKDEAISQYINKCDYKSKYVSPKLGIEAILKSKGVPVLAHPSYGNGNQHIVGDEMQDRIEHLLEFGLKGVEAYYSGFTKKLEREMLWFADKYDLYVTAGSDYHGKNKLVVLGDTNIEKVSEGTVRLQRFIADIIK